MLRLGCSAKFLRRAKRGFCSEYEKSRGMKNSALDNLNLEGVTIVRTNESAMRVLKTLRLLKDR